MEAGDGLRAAASVEELVRRMVGRELGAMFPKQEVEPGAVVLEAGIGWGALAIKLLEAVGPSGRLVSYEVREDFAESGRKTVTRFLGECENHEIKVRDIYQGIDETEVDRVVLDLPEPWHVVPHAADGQVS